MNVLILRNRIPFAAVLALSLVSIQFSAMQSAFGVTVIQDNFDNGSANSGASALPGGTWAQGGNLGETGGKLTLTTAAIGTSNAIPNRWSGTQLSTTFSSNLNVFDQTISIAIREFTFANEGDHAGVNSRFRIGLMSRDNLNYSNPSGTTPVKADNNFTQFYNNGNDGLAVNFGINASGFTTFDVRYKRNVVSATDPNSTSTGGTGSIGFTMTGFDFNVNSTTWQLVFYGDGGQSSTVNGTWSLGSKNPSTPDGTDGWGNAADGWGNAAFIMGVQNMGEEKNSDPVATYNGSVTATVGSVLVTSVPEPTLSLLLFGGITSMLLRRRKKAQA